MTAYPHCGAPNPARIAALEVVAEAAHELLRHSGLQRPGSDTVLVSRDRAGALEQALDALSATGQTMPKQDIGAASVLGAGAEDTTAPSVERLIERLEAATYGTPRLDAEVEAWLQHGIPAYRTAHIVAPPYGPATVYWKIRTGRPRSVERGPHRRTRHQLMWR
jgi:hypothetical protein